MKKLFFAVFGLFPLSLSASAAPAIDAAAIMRKAEKQLRGDSMIADARLRVVRGGDIRSVGFLLITEGADKAFVRVTAPIKDKHISQLRLEDNIWRYNPKVDQIHRIAGSELGAAWMGSDITYEDIIRNTQVSDLYDVSFSGEEKIANVPCYRIEAVRKKTRSDSGSEKMIVWISKNEHTLLRQDLLNEKGEVRRRLETKRIEQFGNLMVPVSFVIRSFPAPKDHFTTLEFKRLTVNEAVPPVLFSQTSLRRKEDIDFIPKRMISGAKAASKKN